MLISLKIFENAEKRFFSFGKLFTLGLVQCIIPKLLAAVAILPWGYPLTLSKSLKSKRIELLDSRFSKKKRLFKNGVSILNTIEDGNFIHNFGIEVRTRYAFD